MIRHEGLQRSYGGGLAAVALAQIPAVLAVSWTIDVAGLLAAVVFLALFEPFLMLASWRLMTDRVRHRIERGLHDEAAVRAQLQEDARCREAASASALQGRVSDALAAFQAAGSAGLATVNTAAEGLSRTSDDMSRAALRISSETMSLSVAAEDADRQIAQVVASGQEFLKTIAHIGDNASRSAQMGVEVFDLTRATTATIGDLTAASEKIGTLTTLISGIANQTNLLALNATIEAARAGEQGRGFAVVAGEVKNLAMQTTKAVAMIVEMVEMIRASGERANHAMSATADSIGSLNQATAKIAAAVEERVEAASLMARSIAKTASNVAFVKASLGNIEAAVDEAIQGAGFLRATATEIADHAGGVRDQLGRCVETIAAASLHPIAQTRSKPLEAAS